MIRNIKDKKVKKRILMKDGKPSVKETIDLRKDAKPKPDRINMYHTEIRLKGVRLDKTIQANAMSFKGKKPRHSIETEEQSMDNALMRLSRELGGEYDRDAGLRIIESGKYKVTIKTGIVSYGKA
jgi:Ser-tRNA(Ala) deacylase AlaX